jgi:hypothetical protein
MKLSRETVDNILHVIATFDRERGIPHDYHDLEVVLRNTSFVSSPSGELVISKDTVGPMATSLRKDSALDDAIEGKEMLLKAAREWLD